MARIIEKQVSPFKISFPSDYETFRFTFLEEIMKVKQEFFSRGSFSVGNGEHTRF
jgi:hypothetical protein